MMITPLQTRPITGCDEYGPDPCIVTNNNVDNKQSYIWLKTYMEEV